MVVNDLIIVQLYDFFCFVWNYQKQEYVGRVFSEGDRYPPKTLVNKDTLLTILLSIKVISSVYLFNKHSETSKLARIYIKKKI